MKRRKIWELDGTLHCSLVGTCLTTAELRTLVRKFVVTAKEYPTDHELHGIAVTSVGKADLLGKQIQKAMDRRHHIAIKRFDAAATPDEVLAQWAEAMKTGDIPGAYWAALTHGQTDLAVVRKVFGEVHMLSHLVGAANRADIRRLHQLEETNASLEATIARQSAQLRDGIMARDAKIRELTTLATSRIEHTDEEGTAPEVEALHRLVADLKKQVDLEIVRRLRAEKKVEQLLEAKASTERRLSAAEREITAMAQELAALEEIGLDSEENDAEAWSLDGLSLLYVGGRPHQITRIREAVEQASGHLIHHDGGVEERQELLTGLVSRADMAVFPVDCISHSAALLLKRMCRQLGKPYLPLRTSGLASLVSALKMNEQQNLAAAE